jgi:hypothetical protein
MGSREHADPLSRAALFLLRTFRRLGLVEAEKKSAAACKKCLKIDLQKMPKPNPREFFEPANKLATNPPHKNGAEQP